MVRYRGEIKSFNEVFYWKFASSKSEVSYFVLFEAIKQKLPWEKQLLELLKLFYIKMSYLFNNSLVFIIYQTSTLENVFNFTLICSPITSVRFQGRIKLSR